MRPQPHQTTPNVIFILSDDMSWIDMGCYGQDLVDTPHLDALCDGGMRFTGCHAGAPVCAPSRSTLMQGMHLGHAAVRENMKRHPHGGYRHSLQDGDYTVAHLFKEAGYATGMFGKWGLGLTDQPGIPENMGYDEFVGYLNQRKAHNYYPEYLWKNNTRIDLPENIGHQYRDDHEYDSDGNHLVNGVPDPMAATYSLDVCEVASLRFIEDNKDNPFFMYLPVTIPHGVFEVPNLLQYKDKDWPTPAKEYAAMLTYFDESVGRLVAQLKSLDLYDNTLIVFASDNGYSHSTTACLEEIFKHKGPYRGQKGNLLQGGVRVPAFVHWANHVPAGVTDDTPWAFHDFLPTMCELLGRPTPQGLDGISVLPLWTQGGASETGAHLSREYLYWEFNHEQAARIGAYYCYRSSPSAAVAIYHADEDPGQVVNLAATEVDLVARAEAIFASAHTQSLYFPSPGETVESWWQRLEAADVVLPNNVDG